MSLWADAHSSNVGALINSDPSVPVPGRLNVGAPSDVSLRALVREDLRAHQLRAQGDRAIVSGGFHVMALYRLGNWYPSRAAKPLRPLLRVLYLTLASAARYRYGIELSAETRVGRRVVFGHQAGTVVRAAGIGDDCLIRQNVTIGALYAGGPVPTIGNRVEIGVGAVLVGDIFVGDDAVIGPNAVVSFDVPAGASVVAPTARVLPATLEREVRGGPLPPEAQRVMTVDPEAIARLAATRLALSEVPGVSDPLLSSGLIDSLNFAEFVDALEEEFDVHLEVDALDVETFDTPELIARAVVAAKFA